MSYPLRMLQRTDDLRITETRPLIPPAILLEEIPVSETASNVVSDTRTAVSRVIAGSDPRLVVIVGPCSIHDPKAALDYAARLRTLADRYAGHLIVLMRSYFEKPRTSVGWKGLINDPDLDESFHINKGLRLARRLLLDVNEMGLPTASEFLDVQIPQHIADLTSWVAIGARTTESQVHRELASGLSMPVGFKNGTDGNTQTAVDAVLAARSPHWFPSVTKQGVSAIFHTVGNESCHVILRGGSRTGPNFDAAHVLDVCAKLQKHGLPDRVMIDCSHGNSHKDHTKQKVAAAAICAQVAGGSWNVFGTMIESHLVEGRQDYVPGQPAVYGQSITDACISLEQTEPLLDQLAAAQQTRGTR
ncbi:MAG TPA: 3-deoxy-7-phosphoheptulonate synthase [Vicinamibacterales bacterium]|nr:3-deoxy-7-phosphoheptulonate synthase [Vicinamibacterales bacterium]